MALSGEKTCGTSCPRILVTRRTTQKARASRRQARADFCGASRIGEKNFRIEAKKKISALPMLAHEDPLMDGVHDMGGR